MTDDIHILQGTPVVTDIGATLGQLLQQVIGGHGDKVLQVDAITGEELTASKLLSWSTRLAKWLQTQGLSVGDTISISSENNFEFTAIFCAALLSGVTFAPVNHAYTTTELQHILKIIKPKIIFSTSTGYRNLCTSLKIIQSPAIIVFIGHPATSGLNIKNTLLLDEIFKNETKNQRFVSPNLDVHETIAAIMCSSGTTGMPKGVMLTQHNIIAMLCIMKQNAAETGLASIPGVSIGLVPFFHSMGLLVNFITLLSGTKLLIFKKFVWNSFLKTVQNYKINTLVIPPSVILMLCQSPDVKNYDLSSVEYIKSSAAPMNKELQNKALKQFNLKDVTQGYGLTEATLGVLLVPKINKFGSVGKIVPGMKVKVVDEWNRALGPYERGELCFSGPLIMRGYAADPIATSLAIDRDNWLHTGDVGYYDNDCYFYIVDRLKELIKYKGYQVPPAELEGILLTHPAVEDAAVIGLPDDLAGELPLAYVVLRPRVTKPTVADIQAFVHEKVSPQKHLRGGVRFIDQIPRNITGKALRRILRDMAIANMSKL